MAERFDKIAIPNEYRSFIGSVSVQTLGGSSPAVAWERQAANRVELEVEIDIESAISFDDWNIRITPAFQPDFFWTPHLTPDAENVVDMHVFRTPALMMGNKKHVLSVLPHFRNMNGRPYRSYMDLDAPGSIMTFGVSATEVCDHVLYRRAGGAMMPSGKFSFRIVFLLQQGRNAVSNPFREVLKYFWNGYGSNEYHILPEFDSLDRYAGRTYEWAFNHWKSQVWQEFTVNGKKVGAPAFIVTVFQSPNYPGEHSIREELSIWNQAWFSSLRSATGLFRYAQMKRNDDLMQKALMTKELALSFPQENGLFDAVIAVPNRKVVIDGNEYTKEGSWDHYYWGNSNRNPHTYVIADSPYHILDMSWTALHMLRWYSELEQDGRLLDYAKTYADRLLNLQDGKGFFPAWIDKKTGAISDYLRQSPETAVSATFLIHLYFITRQDEYLASALKAVDAVAGECLATGRWEDFETYWSCCRYGNKTLVGQKVERNDIYKQCNFSMFFTAEALLAAYQQTGDNGYLSKGQRCLDELLMTQSSFQPDYIPIPVIGGFGVMNCDGELNDSRQSLFSELIIRYGILLGKEEYIQRGYAALRASFTMMFCPENPEGMKMWNAKWPFLKSEDYGFMMENYGHNGYADKTGEGIGEFTIYDWGNGAASEAYMRIKSHIGNIDTC
ncbi:MAG: hypothetical protein ACYC5K_11685 [Saccharofermentanales bacterium]